MKKLSFILVIALGITGCSYNDKTNSTAGDDAGGSSVKAKVIKSGLFRVVRSGGLVASAHTSTGKAFVKPVIQMVKAGNRIPLVKDAHMSMQYRIWNLPEQPAYIPLKRVLRHPPMTLPDGRVTTGSEYMITGKVSAGQVIAYTGYGLNEAYEMLEGDWTFEIWQGGNKLVEYTFTTYWPDAADAVQIQNSLHPTARESVIKAVNIRKKPVSGKAAAVKKWL